MEKSQRIELSDLADPTREFLEAFKETEMKCDLDKLGELLDLNAEEQERLKSDSNLNGYDDKAKLLVEICLERQSPESLWKQLANALRKPGIKAHATAARIEDYYMRRGSSASMSSNASTLPSPMSLASPTSPTLSSVVLEMKDLYPICCYLYDLDNKHLIRLGVALGLLYPCIKNMSTTDNFIEDLIYAWLLKKDHVLSMSGQPTWGSLAKCLDDIGHKGIATKIREEKGGVNPSVSKVTFPIRESRHILSVEGRQKEERTLLSASKTIINKFCALRANILASLTEMDVTRVIKCLKRKEIDTQNISTMDDVEDHLMNNSSFYDYDIVEYVIHTVGTESDKKEFESYEEAFHRYAQRRVYECPSTYGAVQTQNDTQLHVKLDSLYDEFTVNELKDLEGKLCNILQINVYVVRLLRVDTGCFDLTFLMPASFEMIIFPLFGDQIRKLQELHVLLLGCGHHFIDIEKCVVSLDTSEQGVEMENSMECDDIETPNRSLASVSDVRSKTKEFEERFSRLVYKTKSELSDQKRSKAPVGTKLKQRTSPCSIKKKHYRYVRRIARRRDKRFVKMEEFLPYLDMYSYNCFEYKLLEEVVNYSKCSSVLRAKMFQYSRDVQKFQQSINCSTFFHEQNVDSGEYEIPPNFGLIATKHNVDPDVCTPADLATFRTEACSSMEISEYALMNVSSTFGSINVKWMFPIELRETVISFFSGKTSHNFLLSHHIESVSVMDEIVYRHSMRSQDTCTLEDVDDFEEVKHKDVHIDHPSELLLSAIQHQEVEKVKFLLEDKDAEVDIECTDENGCTPLFIATMLGSMEIVKLLTDKKADVNAFDKNGKTVLMAAVESENKDLVEMYLDEHQCDVNVQEKEFGWSALHFAAKLGRTDIVTLLLRPVHNTEIMLEDNDRNTAIDVAIKHDKVEIVKLLRSEAGIESGRFSLRKSKLIQAAKKGLTDEVKRLLEEEKKNPNTVKGDRDGWTPLMYASHQGYTEIVELLLKHGADPDMQSSGEGWTALILASYRGFVEVVQLLLKYGCNVNIITKKKKFTALQRVCLYSQTRYIFLRFKPSERNGEVTKLLLDHGADITLLDFQNRTPLIAASRSGFPLIVKHILDRLSSEDAEPKFSKEEQKKYLDKAMDHHWTALMEASEEGNAEIVHMLLEAGATPNKTKKDKESALHVAAYHGQEVVVEMLAAKMKKEDINAKNEDGMTPLMLAVKRKKTRIQEKIKIIDQLMEQGADITIQTDSNKTAMSYAQKFGSRDVIERIRYWGSATKEVTRGLTKEGVREVKRLMKGQRSEETETAELPVS